MKHCGSVTLTRGLHHGQHAWLLRWREHGVLLTYWFVDEHEARTVRGAMIDGATFDDAFRLVWHP